MQKASVILVVMLVCCSAGCVTTREREQQQRDFYENQRKFQQQINQTIGEYNKAVNEYNEILTTYTLNRKIFARSLASEQRNAFDNYQEEKTHSTRMYLEAILMEEQKNDFSLLIEEDVKLQGYEKILIKWRGQIAAAQEQIIRLNQQWLEATRQQDFQQARTDAAVMQFFDAMNKMGDDMYRRSRY
jgi:hypothetical protein